MFILESEKSEKKTFYHFKQVLIDGPLEDAALIHISGGHNASPAWD